MYVNLHPINVNSNLSCAYNKISTNFNALNSNCADKVSFSARAQLISQHLNYAPPLSLCMRVADAAEPARYYLESVLNKYIGSMTDETDELSAKKFPVLSCKTRVKSPVSIREKVVSKYAKNYSLDAKNFAEEMYSKLAANFKQNPKVNKATIINEILSVIDGTDSEGNWLAYKNVLLFFNMALNVLSSKQYFDFDAFPRKVQIDTFSSIIEQMEEKKNSIIHDVSPLKTEGVKRLANDIIGARIVLRDSDPANTGRVIEALKQAVQNGHLKIVSVENNLPNSENLSASDSVKRYAYAPDHLLRSLACASDAELITNTSKTGYIGIHINVDLSNPELAKVNDSFDGFQGEIQILGKDVEQLKDIEDLCYKLKDNKSSTRREYEPFKRHFRAHYTGDAAKTFDAYTYSMYLYQRLLESSGRSSVFPSPAQLGFDDLPPELDFNTLKLIKVKCDNDVKKQDMIDAIHYLAASSMNKKKIYLDRDVREARNIVSFLVK